MAIPVITLLVTSVLIGIQMVLTALVIKARRGSQIAIGSDGVPYLERAVRAHGNFIEVTPIFLISLLLLELVNSYLWWVAILGLVFSVGRVLHARSLLVAELRSGSYRQRVLGMMLTMIALTASAISGVVWVVWNLM
jgi:uncharacterized membrane protein YecN with MAPEG domain